MTTLIALHGFTQNGSQFRAHLTPLIERLPAHVVVEVPHAPHTCSEAGVTRLEQMMASPRLPPPHLAWWDATDDGHHYRGWETSLELIRGLAQSAGSLGLIGFSQGAILAAALTALAEDRAFPALRFVVLVAGRKPRAEIFQPLFARELATSSLHVWGERDAFGNTQSAQLVQNFSAETREVVKWPGPHVLPTHGPGADAIVDFVARHAEA